jgi:energy-converting hydrogenase Eha subunit A
VALGAVPHPFHKKSITVKIFLSSTRKGALVARRLSQDLKTHGFDVWFDQLSIQPGEAWASKIADAIKSADAVIVVVAPDSGVNQWQSTEVALAVASYRYGKLIIPVLASKGAEIPFFLRQFQAADLSDESKYEKGLDPLVAVLRAPTARIELAEAVRSREQLLDAQKFALESAMAELEQVQAAKSSRFALQVVILLTVVVIASGLVIASGIRQRIIEFAIVGNVIGIVSALIGYYLGRRFDPSKSSPVKRVDSLEGIKQ